MEWTPDQIKEMPCKCGAQIGEPCLDKGTTIIGGFHKERVELRAKFPTMPLRLDVTDKTIITFYAFVILCEAVAKKSVEILGREHSAQQVQMAFVQEAIKQARQDGFIGPAPEQTPFVEAGPGDIDLNMTFPSGSYKPKDNRHERRKKKARNIN